MTVEKTPIKDCIECGYQYPETEPVCPSCHTRDCDECGTQHDDRRIYTIKLFAGQRFLCSDCRAAWLETLMLEGSCGCDNCTCKNDI